MTEERPGREWKGRGRETPSQAPRNRDSKREERDSDGHGGRKLERFRGSEEGKGQRGSEER